MTQLYVLSQSGDSAVNLGRFEYVYIGDDNKIKAVCGQRVIRLGDYDSRARLWERQLEDSIKAGVHKAKVETKRKARVNALATNVLSDAARQQAALKVQQDFFGGGYR